MEAAIREALPGVKEDANPAAMDNDWTANFFNKVRHVSDIEMRTLWSRVLAGEANAPGAFSKRTVNFLASLDKSEAELFARFCGFVWDFGELRPLIFDYRARFYIKQGISFRELDHLSSIGLIRFAGGGSYFTVENLPKHWFGVYYGRTLLLELPKSEDNTVNIGKATLTRTGLELFRICESNPVEGFWEYVLKHWKAFNPRQIT